MLIASHKPAPARVIVSAPESISQSAPSLNPARDDAPTSAGVPCPHCPHQSTAHADDELHGCLIGAFVDAGCRCDMTRDEIEEAAS